MISRKELLKELLPGLTELFGVEYAKYDRKLHGGNDAVHGLAPDFTGVPEELRENLQKGGIQQ